MTDQLPFGAIEPIELQEEMEQSFLVYALSTITARALPDVRDGLKPVHRRILWDMFDQGFRPDRPHVKCARVTGSAMARYHPHGNQAIYDALVRLAQPFSLRHPLIDFHGNYGSPDFEPAAERYCITADSLVRTAEGTVPIAELAGRPLLPDSEADIDVKVLDKFGNPVVASKLFHSGLHPTLRLRTTDGYEITGTHNHPLLCLEHLAGVHVPMWKRMDEIGPGDAVLLLPGDPGPEEPSTTERRHALLAATLLRGGEAGGRLGEVVAAFDAVVGGPRSVRDGRLVVGSLGPVLASPVAEAVADEPRVPSFVWRGTAGVKRAFLDALLADGTWSPATPRLAHEVRQLALEAVFVASVAPGATHATKTVGSVEPAGVREVYSIRVESECHSFIANGFVNHNTECRLSPLAMHMLAGIDEDTVDFGDNYSGEFREPLVLPARFPNLLVNGSQGIAVGMATNIPPHNLAEVVDATLHLVDHPEATPDELMEFVKGPDFPTGAYILGRAGIIDAYRTGRGSVKMRAKAEIVEGRTSDEIVVTELPYQVSVNTVATKIAELVDNRQIEGIRDVKNLSSRENTRLVVYLKRDANANVVLNNLYKHTPLQTSFAVNSVALVDGVPRTLNLAQLLTAYVAHQVEVITRRSQHRLNKARRRAHIVEGLLKALDAIDAIIALIRGSDDKAAARAGLMAPPFEFSEEQAEHILDMTLARLTRLGRSELEQEMAKLREAIAELEAILGDPARLRAVIKGELTEIRERFAAPRRAEITFDAGDLDALDLIEDEELVVTLTKAGYVKTVAADSFRTQGRGGRGVAGAKLRDNDYVIRILTTTAHAYLLFFSNRGRVYRLRAHEIPMKERTARGTAIVNLLPLQPGERIQAVIDTRDYETSRYLLFVTRRGQVKKTRFTEYDSSLRAGIIAINLKEGDELVRVIQTSGEDDIFMVSRTGMTIRFLEEEVRASGRAAQGVIGMRLRDDDEVVSSDVARPEADLVVVTDAGYGKRTKIERFPKKGRGTMGVKGIRLTARRGSVVAAFMAGLDDEIFVISSSGTTIRMRVREISSQGRDATGVKVMNLDEGQTVAAVAPVLSGDE
jgi:DNA gyrase subunit A